MHSLSPLPGMQLQKSGWFKSTTPGTKAIKKRSEKVQQNVESLKSEVDELRAEVVELRSLIVELKKHESRNQCAHQCVSGESHNRS